MGNKILKIVYRVIILLAIFVSSLIYFSRDIKEVVFNIDNTTVMEETTIPLVTISSLDIKINLLHGYSTNLDANSIREAITPLGSDQTFRVIFQEDDYVIKKLNYELREFNGNELIETDSVSVFEENGREKSAKVKLKTELALDREYAVKITLITSESKKLYFYHRVKRMENSYLEDKLEFVMHFHNSIKNKETAEWIIDRLETDRKKENTTLAKVNINSSFELVTWGNLKPVFLTEVIPRIIEISPEMASVELSYIIQAEIAGVQELFEVKEFYRVQYTRNQIYLLNYDRSMESIFDARLASVNKSQLKLGITSDLKVPYVISDDKKKLAFVRNRELWKYNLENNEMVRIFSFRQENSDYIRDLYDQHDIRILNMDAEGNINFLVYGYMNRGQYEGRVAVILYEYISSNNRIEEKVYIPVEEPYQSLKENLGSFAYVNSLDVFYFHLYHSLYAYNMITGELTELAVGINKDQVVDLKNQGYVAWQVNSDPELSKEIRILELETGKVESIATRTGYNILLLDMIDSNLIYGFVVEGDVTTLLDGRRIIPMNMLEIATVKKETLKNYSKAGYYITDIEVVNNVIELTRVFRENSNEGLKFMPAPKDYLMNRITDEVPFLGVASRVTEEALTETYMTFPASFAMAEVPKISHTINNVIAQDPTLRLPEHKTDKMYYYPYIAGDIRGIYEEAADAITAAGEGVGVVLNSNSEIVWERGVKAVKSMISSYEDLELTATDKTLENCIRLLLKNLGRNVPVEQTTLNGRTVIEVLEDNMDNTPVRLTGISLEDALYYISKGRPVIAMTNYRDAVLIYGYDTFNINVIDVKQGKVKKIGLQDSKELFEGAGNVFISYLD